MASCYFWPIKLLTHCDDNAIIYSWRFHKNLASLSFNQSYLSKAHCKVTTTCKMRHLNTKHSLITQDEMCPFVQWDFSSTHRHILSGCPACCWRCSIVVRTLVSASELSLSCTRLLAGRVTTLWLSRPLSANMANSAIHPSWVGKWVVIHVIRYTDYGVKA